MREDAQQRRLDTGPRSSEPGRTPSPRRRRGQRMRMQTQRTALPDARQTEAEGNIDGPRRGCGWTGGW